MADLQVFAYASTAGDGNIQAADRFLGSVTISTLSTSSQGAVLPLGTRLVRLKTDATVAVFFTFGEGSAPTATTAHDAVDADVGEKVRFVGVNGKGSGNVPAYIAARIA